MKLSSTILFVAALIIATVDFFYESYVTGVEPVMTFIMIVSFATFMVLVNEGAIFK